ncbi:hypothetical protein FGSG_03270 [Fusarium graminearum PH-1]|uniref:hypothetical protein n=1 Tax=Gibberella zeae (strain ATCC MYA-4620 / CBS 123657 / FGSC 9075 / NRRL 31084 / PH-1) TaxID=229533 RepID=UPI000023D70C|nr:hypothetical protein FGSG_03270 [Fusarium graminearum PH-1]ESU09979.1 hypothetical protein FGSG_03270 [Fusarium graminearum PH-1]|eukprot:XP_011322478.1 hypothetical protein FGSG_03270 [Fusarium graminearum PH-1]
MSFPIFNEATTSFIVPLCLLSINLVDYLYSGDDRLTGINCVLSIYLLASYFNKDSPSQPIIDGDVKSPQTLDTGKQTKQAQKKAHYFCLGDGCSENIYDRPCTPFSGKSGPGGSITYRYEGWGYCNAEAERGAIINAVIQHISEHGSKLTSTECLKLSGRDLSYSYLVIGPTDNFDFEMDCGPKPDWSTLNQLN